MALLTNLVLIFSALLLAHACYSAHEHSSTRLTASLPLDIVLETLIGAALFTVGIVTSQAELRPIVYKVWTGKQERETGSGPVAPLEERGGFLDIRTKRAEFANFVKEAS